jgi:hypothetical protein
MMTNPHKCLILRTHSDDEDFNADCDVALVELTPALIGQILARAKLALELHKEDVDLFELYYWGSTVECYSENLIDDCIAELPDNEVDQWLKDLDEGIAQVVPVAVDPAKRQPERTECNQMIIRISGPWENGYVEVAWTCMPKHCDFHVVTDAIKVVDPEKRCAN